MQKYNVFLHPNGAIESVKQGWSWPAFFFGPVWALVKKMWMVAIGSVLAMFLIALVIGPGHDPATGLLLNIVSICMYVIFGSCGNGWREKNLVSRGFDLINTVTADSVESANAVRLPGTPVA